MNMVEIKTEVFNIRSFGAKGDGVSMDTDAIQAAIDTCAENGGGIVIFPAGNYLIGSIFIKSNVTLYLAAEATLLGSKKLRDYAINIEGCHLEGYPFLNKCLIYAENVKNIGLVGQGSINGQGQAFPFKSAENKMGERPMLMRFVNCQNIFLTGLTLKDAGSWCSNFISCDNIKIDAIKIHNRANGNNDGFDIDGCQNVSISNCNLSCDDDAIALKTTQEKPCKNIVITNCVISSQWAAFRLGPESLGSFEDITISNCVVYDTYGSAIKLQMCEGTKIENVLFSNLVMKNVTGPISLHLTNCSLHPDCQDKKLPSIGTLHNILFNNIRAEVAKEPQPPRRWPGEHRSCISIIGSPGHNIEGIMLSNVHITYPGGGTSKEAARRKIPELRQILGKPFPQYPEYFSLGILPAYGLYARHARDIVLNNVQFNLSSKDMRPAIVCDDVENLEICDLRAESNLESECLIRLCQTRQAFIHGCRPINDIETFLHVEGQKSQGITLIANDLNKAKSAVQLSQGAKSQAVITSSNSTRD